MKYRAKYRYVWTKFGGQLNVGNDVTFDDDTNVTRIEYE